MARRIIVFEQPDRFVCGTVGEPGNRTFFLQTVQGPRVTSVVLEKVQVAVLADRLGHILGELERRGVKDADAPAIVDLERPLDEPLREEFRVGTIALAWDDDDGVLTVEARAQTEDEEEDTDVEDDDEDGPDLVRVSLSPPVARGFVERAARLLDAGRPPCPFCGEPLDPQGHLCPRRNGYLN
ncbi:MAG: DUF3090 family protein [Candidatus Limnocylindrales bacterium]